MPVSLPLCFDAPMQSWGIRSHNVVRDTTTEPTKSGVVGLLAAALGIPRDDDAGIAVLAGLRLAVRVDREGRLEKDFQTAQNVPTTHGTGHRTVISDRYYLADALFLVALEGDRELLASVCGALRRPRWRPYLGRRAFVPARPFLLPGAGPDTRSAEEVLATHPWLETSAPIRRRQRAAPERSTLRTVADCAPSLAEAETRQDHPLSFAPGRRRFASRSVVVGEVPLTSAMLTAEPREARCS